jgi:DNA-binding LacI/PurR family transcriptional regulator
MCQEAISLKLTRKVKTLMSAKQRRITSKDVALKAGVSQATVSYVLNNDPRQSIPEETRIKVLDAVRKLDYQPYAPARSLRLGKSKIVLVVYPELVLESSISHIIEELTAATAELGYSLVWQMGFSPESQHLSANLTPAVVVALVDAADTAAMESLKRFKAPIVTLAGRNWFDNGPRLQVEHLLKQGSRPIVFAGTEKFHLQTMCQARLGIVRQTCITLGLAEPRSVIIPQSREKARQAMADLLAVQPPPFALCAFNDDVAIVALAALSDLNIAVPKDVSVIGHDNTPLSEFTTPPLTTIGVTSLDLSERLIAGVISILQGGPVLETISLSAEVVVRDSA